MWTETGTARERERERDRLHSVLTPALYVHEQPHALAALLSWKETPVRNEL